MVEGGYEFCCSLTVAHPYSGVGIVGCGGQRIVCRLSSLLSRSCGLWGSRCEPRRFDLLLALLHLQERAGEEQRERGKKEVDAARTSARRASSALMRSSSLVSLGSSAVRAGEGGG